jgi:flagellar basal body P-ring formation protein FlgA
MRFILLTIAALGLTDLHPVQGEVLIELQPVARVSGRLIRLHHLATVVGEPQAMVDRIKELDVGEFASATEPLTISSRQISFRLRLADIPEKATRIRGADQCVASAERQPIKEAAVIEAAKEAIVLRYPWKREDLDIRQVQPIAMTLPPVLSPDEVKIKAELHSSKVYAGRTQVDISLWENGTRIISFPVFFDVQPAASVFVVSAPIQAGILIDPNSVKLEKRRLDAGAKPINTWDRLLGRKAKRPLNAGEPILETDMENANLQPKVKTEPVALAIKAKQTVKIQLDTGKIRIQAQGEALQDGRIGDIIRVQNIDSKRIVLGRVVAPQSVEVELGGSP